MIPPVQVVVTLVLMLLLGGLSIFFFWRQLRALRQLKDDETTPGPGGGGPGGDPEATSAEDRRHFRAQAWRRLVSAALLGVLALLLAGSFLFEGRAAEVSEEIKAAQERGEADGPREDQKPFIRFYGGYWIAFLLVLFGVIALAFWDVLAIRRYGQRQFAKIQADRRAMIERQAARMRGERNGHSGK
jgi:hypothetical protein